VSQQKNLPLEKNQHSEKMTKRSAITSCPPRRHQPLPSHKNISLDFFGIGDGKGNGGVGCSGGGGCWWCGGSGNSIGGGGGGGGCGGERLVTVAVVAVLVVVSVVMAVARMVLELAKAMGVAVVVAGQWG
jgi:hypothetical protein